MTNPAAPNVPRIGWNVKAARYVNLDTGRFIGQSQILDTLEIRIEFGQERVTDLLAAALQGTGSFAEFQDAFLAELKYAHTQAAALGRGGWNQVSQSDWGKVGNVLRNEYAFARDFLNEINQGNLSIAQIEARMKQYENKIWNQFWEGNRSGQVVAGKQQERRELQPAEHCGDCIDLAGRGWQPIGTLPTPGDGSTQCGSNDKCTMAFK